MNITISLETPQDIPQVQQVIVDAFGSHEEAALVNQLRQDPGWLPALSLVAKDRHGAVIGHVVCTRASVGAHPAVTLAPLSVRPEYQGSGVGSALMLACIEAARAAGEKIITVLGHPHYYPRFGFIPAAGCGVTCRLNNGPDDAKMVMSLDGAPIPPGEMGFCRPMTEAIQAYQPAADNPSATN